MFATIAATILLAPQSKYLTCAVNNNDSAGELYSEYNGMRVSFCCEGCVPQFGKEPEKFLKQSTENKVTVAESYFDPTTGKKIKFEKAKGFSDYRAVRYYFATEDGKKTFDKDPKKYATTPKKDALWCPVMKEEVESYSKADSYVDFEGVRYYMCCGGCYEPMKKDPAKYANPAKAGTPKVITPKAN